MRIVPYHFTSFPSLLLYGIRLFLLGTEVTVAPVLS